MQGLRQRGRLLFTEGSFLLSKMVCGSEPVEEGDPFLHSAKGANGQRAPTIVRASSYEERYLPSPPAISALTRRSAFTRWYSFHLWNVGHSRHTHTAAQGGRSERGKEGKRFACPTAIDASRRTHTQKREGEKRERREREREHLEDAGGKGTPYGRLDFGRTRAKGRRTMRKSSGRVRRKKKVSQCRRMAASGGGRSRQTSNMS